MNCVMRIMYIKDEAELVAHRLHTVCLHDFICKVSLRVSNRSQFESIKYYKLT